MFEYTAQRRSQDVRWAPLLVAWFGTCLLLPRTVSVSAFTPSFSSKQAFATSLGVSSSVNVDVKKPTGTSFLPEETIELAKKGSPVEKVKLQKDGTAAFVDVYEYARKIREGEMTWEEVEKADLDSVSLYTDDPVVSFLLVKNDYLIFYFSLHIY